MLTNETGRPIVVKFDSGRSLLVQPFKGFNKNAMVEAFGVIRSVRFKK